MPSVFDFMDFRLYLKAYYEGQKSQNRRFSYQIMAWKAGFRSKSFFKELIDGKKNLASASVFSVGKSLGLEGDSFAYFEALVAFNQARTTAMREHAFRWIVALRPRGKLQVLAKQQYQLYSHWYHNTLRELVTWFDFQNDFGRLGRMVKPPISAGKARASVRLLLQLELIARDGNLYRQTEPDITTGDEVLSAAVAAFHQQNMGLVRDAIDTVPAPERDISSLVAGLSPEGFQQIKRQIQDFRKKLVEVIRNDKPAQRVYHINFQIFPTTEAQDA